MKIVKRIVDLLLVLGSLPLWLPIVLAISGLCWCRMGRPIFFKQSRAGLEGKEFFVLKFRTMSNDLNEAGELLPDKERLTSFGSWLRSTSLDELPELFNIVRGEMSLVGPRPLHLRYVDRYNDEQKGRLSVVPGLTGWAQVNGRNAVGWEERFEMDLWYIDNWSLWLDLKIILRTLGKVLFREGISAEGEATMQEFVGKGSEGAPHKPLDVTESER